MHCGHSLEVDIKKLIISVDLWLDDCSQLIPQSELRICSELSRMISNQMVNITNQLIFTN